MIYIFSVLLTLFVALQIYSIKHQLKVNKEQTVINNFIENSLAEIEKYAYTDIRELNDYLMSVKKKYGEFND